MDAGQLALAAAQAAQHHFSDCAVARAVVQLVQDYLQSVSRHAAVAILTQPHVWLMLPRPDVELAMWRVCCLAALSAIPHGRRLMDARQLSGDAAGPDMVEVAVRSSIATFWQHMIAAGQPHPNQALLGSSPFLPIDRDDSQ